MEINQTNSSVNPLPTTQEIVIDSHTFSWSQRFLKRGVFALYLLSNSPTLPVATFMVGVSAIIVVMFSQSYKPELFRQTDILMGFVSGFLLITLFTFFYLKRIIFMENREVIKNIYEGQSIFLQDIKKYISPWKILIYLITILSTFYLISPFLEQLANFYPYFMIPFFFTAAITSVEYLTIFRLLFRIKMEKKI